MPISLEGVLLLSQRIEKILEGRKDTMTYGDLCKEINNRYCIQYRRNSKWIGNALYELMKRDIVYDRPLKSALVVQQISGMPGDGFFTGAKSLGFQFNSEGEFFNDMLLWIANPDFKPESLNPIILDINFDNIQSIYINWRQTSKGDRTEYIYKAKELNVCDDGSISFSMVDVVYGEGYDAELYSKSGHPHFFLAWMEEGDRRELELTFNHSSEKELYLKGVSDEETVSIIVVFK